MSDELIRDEAQKLRELAMAVGDLAMPTRARGSGDPSGRHGRIGAEESKNADDSMSVHSIGLGRAPGNGARNTSKGNARAD